MAYEMEQFGIKMVLIEPGVIKTNFDNNLKIGQRVRMTTTDEKSPYAEITQKRLSGFKPRFESGLSPTEVAKVILKAIILELGNSSEFRYLVGDDAFKLIDLKKNTHSDKEFRKLVMKGILK
jgi:hypothetical protein